MHSPASEGLTATVDSIANTITADTAIAYGSSRTPGQMLDRAWLTKLICRNRPTDLQQDDRKQGVAIYE